MFAGGVALAVVVGLIRRGSLAGLLHWPFRYEALIAVPFLARFALYLADNYGVALSSAAVWSLPACAFILLVIGLWCNRAIPGMVTAGVGVFLNGLVVLVNGGQMPVSGSAAAATGQGAAFAQMAAAGSYLHQPLTEATRLTFLADIFATPSWLPSQTVFSIGDVLNLVGVFLLVQHLMMRPVQLRQAVPYL